MPMASLELILRLGSRRCQVLLHKRRQVLEVPLPTVLLSLFPILVNVEGGEAVDAVAAAQFSVHVAVGRAVHMADGHLSVVLVFLSKLLPGRCQPLTVTAPGGKELDEGDSGLDLSLEVVLVKLGNRRGSRGLGHLAILGSRGPRAPGRQPGAGCSPPSRSSPVHLSRKPWPVPPKQEPTSGNGRTRVHRT